ncbi:MAG: hypothetical protein ACJASQ_001114 [Crocinitomicaceae bacterium]|jgi:hypothetical protein
MNEVNYTHSAIALAFLFCVVIYGCDNESTKVNALNPLVIGQKSMKIESPNSVVPNLNEHESTIAFTDSIHFKKVKLYIQNNGKHDRVSVSAIAGDTDMMVDYYSIVREDWKITKDHHTRIYFSYDSYSYGNVFLVKDSVHVEPYYIGPKEDIDTLNEIIRPITKLYNALVNEARGE